MPLRGNFRLEKCHSGNSPSEKCPFGELFVRETVCRGTLRLAKVRRGSVYHGNVRRGTVLEPSTLKVLKMEHFFFQNYIRNKFNYKTIVIGIEKKLSLKKD